MEDNAELESFRRQWREEVAHRSNHSQPEPSQSTPAAPSGPRFPPTRHEASNREEEEDAGITYDQSEIGQRVGQLQLGSVDDDAFQKGPQKEPSSALEHFERAVQREEEGSLGDSLQLYRKAYRLDSTVDKTYRNKHFAAAWKRPAQPPSKAASTSTVQPTQDEQHALPTSELVASFASLPIPQAEPLIENTAPPLCPIAKVPSDVVLEIMSHLALIDPASFGRLALVCKRLAYHFAHEQHIWKRLCQGTRFGFGGMHYSFACDVHGHREYTLAPRYTPFPRGVPVQIPKPLSSWSQVFQVFPRIRFTGVYISTINYTRAGASSAYQNVSWNSPIHIVTYYRYLRFYPDGTVISLLDTTEPREVVPHISKENMLAARSSSHRQHHRQVSDHGTTVDGAPDPVPPIAMAAMRRALRGRWHLAQPKPVSDSSNPGSTSDCPSFPDKNQDGPSLDPRDVVVETEGVDPKYVYTLHLTLRSSSSTRPADTNPGAHNPSKNTKLVWKGFWSYNKLTDDWGEFGLRNDRAFVFRRVRGWGMN